jgi:hypothetical protein
MTIICKINLFLTAVAAGTVVGKGIRNEQPLTVVMGFLTIICGPNTLSLDTLPLRSRPRTKSKYSLLNVPILTPFHHAQPIC